MKKEKVKSNTLKDAKDAIDDAIEDAIDDVLDDMIDDAVLAEAVEDAKKEVNDTISKAVEDANEEPTKEKGPRLFDFKNVTKRNIFTAKGRCCPGGKVKLVSSDGNAIDGLEKCAK